MFGLLLLLFTVVPVLELFLLIHVAQQGLGVSGTVGLVVITGVVGAALARDQGIRAVLAIQNAVAAGKLPTEELLAGLCTLVGGVLLITPGILTDALGFALLFPLTRPLFVRFLRSRAQIKLNVHMPQAPPPGMFGGGPVEPEIRDLGTAREVDRES